MTLADLFDPLSASAIWADRIERPIPKADRRFQKRRTDRRLTESRALYRTTIMLSQTLGTTEIKAYSFTALKNRPAF
jgi:hypothetical protein